MNAALRATLTHAVVGAVGASAGIGGAVAMTSGARETIALAVGDSVVPRFSVKTDSVLAVVGSKIVAKRCGQSFIYLRTWRGSVQSSADTVTATVTGCTYVPPPVAMVSVCLVPDTAAMARYHASSDTTIDPALVPCLAAPFAVQSRFASLYRSTPLVRPARPARHSIMDAP